MKFKTPTLILQLSNAPVHIIEQIFKEWIQNKDRNVKYIELIESTKKILLVQCKKNHST